AVSLAENFQRRKGGATARWRVVSTRHSRCHQGLRHCHQGTTDDSNRRWLSLAEYRLAAGIRSVRGAAAAALAAWYADTGARTAGHGLGDFSRELGGYLQRCRVARRLRTGGQSHAVSARRNGRKENSLSR